MPIDLAKIHKRCGTCGVFLPLSEFYHVDETKKYYRAYCKSCMKKKVSDQRHATTAATTQK